MKKENSSKIAFLVRIIFACFLILIGISGIILPMLPGWPLIFWGLFIIGGTVLVDRIILRYLPKKLRKKIIDWLETKERKD